LPTDIPLKLIIHHSIHHSSFNSSFIIQFIIHHSIHHSSFIILHSSFNHRARHKVSICMFFKGRYFLGTGGECQGTPGTEGTARGFIEGVGNIAFEYDPFPVFPGWIRQGNSG
jgi:hypothetical protein